MTNQKEGSKESDYVDEWITGITSQQLEALDRASKIFPKGSQYNIHTLEGMYGQESRFGRIRRKRNSKNPAGDFQISRDVAKQYGLKVNKKVDERFDVDKASICAAKYLNDLDKYFSRPTRVDHIKTIPIEDASERMKFALAAYNAGAETIAKAQLAAQKARKDPTKWDDVKQYLTDAGITDPRKLKEIREYPDKVLNYSKEFKKKSQDDGLPFGWHWITKDGRHILIKK